MEIRKMLHLQRRLEENFSVESTISVNKGKFSNIFYLKEKTHRGSQPNFSFEYINTLSGDERIVFYLNKRLSLINVRQAVNEILLFTFGVTLDNTGKSKLTKETRDKEIVHLAGPTTIVVEKEGVVPSISINLWALGYSNSIATAVKEFLIKHNVEIE